MLGLLSSVRITHIACYCKFFLLHSQVLCQCRLCRADHDNLTYLMLQLQLSHLNGRKLDHCLLYCKHVHSHGFVRVTVTFLLAVYHQSVPLGAKPLETHGSTFFNRIFAVVVLMLHPLWWEDVSVVYNYCWASPAHSISRPSPAGLMTIFYCLRFEIPPTWTIRSPYSYPLLTGWPGYTPRHWVPFSSPPTSRRATLEAFESPSAQVLSSPLILFQLVLLI
jgi:hypothetical protein